MDIVKKDFYEKQFTPVFHVLVALSISCFAWIFMLKPILFRNVTKNTGFFSKNNIISILAMIFWLFIFPIIILSSGALDDTIYYENSSFVKLKFGSVWLGTLFKLGLVLLFFYLNFNFPKSNTKAYKIISILVTFIFVANILEAVVEQLRSPKDLTYDIINGVLGIFVAIMVLYEIYKQSEPVSINTNNGYYVKFGLSLATILAYTFWNISFKSFIHKDSGILLFTFLSLFLPIILNYFMPYSWLQFRAQTLLFYILMAFGFAKNEWSLLPIYNTQGYDPNIDKDNIFTLMQHEKWYRILLIVLTILPILSKFFI